MPNTSPPIDRASLVLAGDRAAAAAGLPVRLLQYGAITAGRAGEQLAALGELADAGVVGFSDDGSPVQDAALFRNALAYAAMLGLPVIDHPEDLRLTAGAEAAEGLIATVLGLRGWPAAAEAEAVARDIALLAEVVRDQPAARLHLTHVSTAASIAHVRSAKAAGLPVTCDVTPHHLALTDEWLAGARRFAWEALDADGRPRDPWRDGVITAAPYDAALRVNPPLRSAEDARACLTALVDGTVDAIATDHAPHTEVDKSVEFGAARPGIAGIETALGILLEAVDAGLVPLARVIEALTTGPWRVLGPGPRAAGEPGRSGVGLETGDLADLVVFDRSSSWVVDRLRLRTKGFGHPLLGRALPGEVVLTVASGRLAHEGRTATA
jgi:dihydroorotase